MPKFLKQFIASLLILVILSGSFLSSPPPARAWICDIPNFISFLQGIPGLGWLIPGDPNPWYDPNTCEFLGKVFQDPEEEMFGERYTYAQVNWILNSLYGLVFPWNLLFNPESVLNNFLEFMNISQSQPSLQDFASLGPAGLAVYTMSYVTAHPPASGIAYTREIAAKFNLVQPAHAQGYGFSNITAVRSLWEASRNSAYLLLVIFLMASGFLVIFRIKISPQATVTVQLLLPRVIITLLMVTFSYAIAGFVIDLIYVVLSLAIFAIVPTSIASTVVTTLAGPTGWSIITMLYLLLITPLFFIPFLGPLMSLVFGIMVLVILLKVAWMLLKTYVELILLIITGPWQIMLGLIPTSSRGGFLSAGFGGWLNNLIAHASVFVVVPLMFLLDFFLFFGPIITIISEVVNAVPVLSSSPIATFLTDLNSLAISGFTPDLPLLPGLPAFATSIIMGYIVVALIPKTAEMIRDALKAPKFAYGSAWGEAIKPGLTAGGAYAQGAAGATSWLAGRPGVPPELKAMADAYAETQRYVAGQARKAGDKIK